MTYEEFQKTNFYTVTKKYMLENMPHLSSTKTNPNWKGERFINEVLRDLYYRKESQGTLHTVA